MLILYTLHCGQGFALKQEPNSGSCTSAHKQSPPRLQGEQPGLVGGVSEQDELWCPFQLKPFCDPFLCLWLFWLPVEKSARAALTLVRNQSYQGSEEINSIALKGVPLFGGNEIFFLTSDNRLRTKFP